MIKSDAFIYFIKRNHNRPVDENLLKTYMTVSCPEIGDEDSGKITKLMKAILENGSEVAYFMNTRNENLLKGIFGEASLKTILEKAFSISVSAEGDPPTISKAALNFMSPFVICGLKTKAYRNMEFSDIEDETAFVENGGDLLCIAVFPYVHGQTRFKIIFKSNLDFVSPARTFGEAVEDLLATARFISPFDLRKTKPKDSDGEWELKMRRYKKILDWRVSLANGEIDPPFEFMGKKRWKQWENDDDAL